MRILAEFLSQGLIGPADEVSAEASDIVLPGGGHLRNDGSLVLLSLSSFLLLPNLLHLL